VATFADGRIEAYVGPTELGAADDLEAVITDFVAGARSTLSVAVQELDSPAIAQALLDASWRGVRVEVFLEQDYLRSPLVGTGSLVHPDHPDPAVLVTGVGADDRSEAWYVVATVAATATQHPAPLRLTGLDPGRRYRLTEEMPRGPGGADLTGAWSAHGTESTGRVLAAAGVALPVLDPEEARVLRLVAVD